jgi:hypothetical protein
MAESNKKMTATIRRLLSLLNRSFILHNLLDPTLAKSVRLETEGGEGGFNRGEKITINKRTMKFPYTISSPPPRNEKVVKTAVKISFLNPGRMIALLKNIIMRGVQMTERRQLRREWTERR